VPDPLPPTLIQQLAAAALAEDRAAEDITSIITVPAELHGKATFLAKCAGVLAGRALAAESVRQLDAALKVQWRINDGAAFADTTVLGTVEGPVRGLLQAERVALNFLQRMSGIATLTSAYVAQVRGTKAVILDTRKTTPGLRDLEKYAVRCGGGTNHRRDLASMAMLKDNHLQALARSGTSLRGAVAHIRAARPGIGVEIEIDRLQQLEDALGATPEWVLLDNMSIGDMAEAVVRTAGRAKLEASGGVTLKTVRAIAETGVDAISVGALTHSAPALDISLDLEF